MSVKSMIAGDRVNVGVELSSSSSSPIIRKSIRYKDDLNPGSSLWHDAYRVASWLTHQVNRFYCDFMLPLYHSWLLSPIDPTCKPAALFTLDYTYERVPRSLIFLHYFCSSVEQKRSISSFISRSIFLLIDFVENLHIYICASFFQAKKMYRTL